MFPGGRMDPRQMRRMMKQMGIETEEKTRVEEEDHQDDGREAESGPVECVDVAGEAITSHLVANDTGD